MFQDRVLPEFSRQAILIQPTGQLQTANRTVRLHFAELDEVAPGQRVFDVMLQGKVALENFDVVKEAGDRYARREIRSDSQRA